MHQDTFPSICHDLSLKLWISGTAELLLCNVYATLHLKPCQSFLLQGGSETIEKQQELHPAFISNTGIYASTGGNTSQIMHARGSLLACSKESNTSLGRSLPLSLSLSPPVLLHQEKMLHLSPSRVKSANPLADSRQISPFAGPYVTNSHSTNKWWCRC